VKHVAEMQLSCCFCRKSPSMKEYELRNFKAAELSARKFQRNLYELKAELYYHPGREVLGHSGYFTPFGV
jgi:hypothetical protein